MASATFTEALKRKIQERIKTATPHFLFRTWHDESGGHARLNIVDSVTPRRFLAKHSRDFFKNDLQDVIDTAVDHVAGGKMPQHTLYSSWTHSPPQMFAWTRHFLNQGYKNLHVCVPDTAKLSGTQMVLHTCAMHELISTKIPGNFDHENLVYGPIEGPTHKAVPLDESSSEERKTLQDEQAARRAKMLRGKVKDARLDVGKT